VVAMKQKEHVIDMEKTDNFVEEQLHSTQPFAQPWKGRPEKVIVNPSVRTRKGRVPSVGKIDLTTTVKSFSIASLQQYTNSFSEENFIRDSRFGKVFLAELPDGEVNGPGILELIIFYVFVDDTIICSEIVTLIFVSSYWKF